MYICIFSFSDNKHALKINVYTGWSQLIFNNKVGFLQKNNLSDLSEAGRMLNSLIEASQALRNCESGLQFWRILPTYSWTKLTSAIDMLEGLVFSLFFLIKK